MSNVIALILMIVACVLCFFAGKNEGEMHDLKKIRRVLDKAKQDAIQADSNMLDKKDVHRPSYEIGYFDGEIETIDIVLDLFINHRGEEVKTNDRRRKK